MIYYAKNDNDNAFIVKWWDNSRGFTRKEVLIFDCYDNKWREYDSSKYYIPANQTLNTVKSTDLMAAVSNIDKYEDRIKFPPNIRKEFLKFLFNKEVDAL